MTGTLRDQSSGVIYGLLTRWCTILQTFSGKSWKNTARAPTLHLSPVLPGLSKSGPRPMVTTGNPDSRNKPRLR
jgi:hypothetical protein